MSDPFETALANLPELSAYKTALTAYKTALTEVTDCATLVQTWLQVHLVEYTAADVIAMTALVLTREREQGG